jgi:hypothetical protein
MRRGYFVIDPCEGSFFPEAFGPKTMPSGSIEPSLLIHPSEFR